MKQFNVSLTLTTNLEILKKLFYFKNERQNEILLAVRCHIL